jgi:hypothetical protein
MIVYNGLCLSLTCQRYIIIIQPTESVRSARIVCSFILLMFSAQMCVLNSLTK